MIIADYKPLLEIWAALESYERILIVGCQGCVTVCLSGGKNAVANFASALKLIAEKKNLAPEFIETAVERQCEFEFLQALRKHVNHTAKKEIVLSLGCGIGVQALVELFPDTTVIPGLNTRFMGMPLQAGIFVERCHACGDCLLDRTGGICPISRCSKSLLNGPCGGSQNGLCEIGNQVPCAWQQIYDRLTTLNQLDRLDPIALPKNWSVSRDGGPRKLIREDWEEDRENEI